MRYNLFHQVHQGLRSLLYQTALEVQHTDFLQTDEAGQALELLQMVTKLFDRHAHTEDNYIFPLVKTYEPSVIDAFEQEHAKDRLLSMLLIESMKLYADADTGEQRREAGRMIQSAYNKFLVFNLEHMLKEEEVLNPIIWHYYSDDELHKVTGTIIQETPAALMQSFNECICNGLNNAEISQWLKTVEQQAPGNVFLQLCQTAEQELPAGRWRKVLNRMTEGEVV